MIPLFVGRNEKTLTTSATVATTVCPRVVIVGAGFAGLNAARALADTEVDVLVLDRNNYHGFWPLLYQVATAGLEPESIVYPVRALLRRHSNIKFLMSEVKEIDLENKVLLTNNHPIEYDYLILAAGSTTNYFGSKNLEEKTYGLKDINDAQVLRNKVLSCFEQAAQESDPVRRKSLMTFVVVGGGPTGVELSGAFAELIRHVLRKDYPMLNVYEARVVMVEGTGRVLSTFPESLSNKALRQLERLGVEVRLNTVVKSVQDGIATLSDDSQIAAETVVWAAGVRASTLAEKVGEPLQRGARIPVQETLNLSSHPEVFIAGDMAHLDGYKSGGKTMAYPMVAQVAIQMGRTAARNILSNVRRNPMKPFKFVDKGTMATIGRSAAVLDGFGLKLSGYPAWVGWLFIHLMYLAGFRNRLMVAMNWGWNYVTYDRGSRVIMKEEKQGAKYFV